MKRQSELMSIIENQEVREEIGEQAKVSAFERGMYFIQANYINDSFTFVDVLFDCISHKLQIKYQS